MAPNFSFSIFRLKLLVIEILIAQPILQLPMIHFGFKMCTCGGKVRRQKIISNLQLNQI